MTREVWQSQNFLSNPTTVSRLLDLTTVNKEDVVLEIGPGTGAITKELAPRVKKVLAVEHDRHLAEKLTQEMVDSFPNIQVIVADFLRYPLPTDKYKVVANIPFNLTADIVRKLLLGRETTPEAAYLIMQDEAAGKFIGQPKATLMSTLLGVDFNVTKLARIDRREFSPTPKVDAAFVVFEKLEQPLIDTRDKRDFEDFVAFGYVHTQRNRSALDALARVFTYKQRTIIDRQLRLGQAGTGELSTEDWVGLYDAYKRYVPVDKKTIVRGAMTKLIKEQAQLPKEYRTRRY